MELIKSLIFLVLGLATLIISLFSEAGLEIIILGSLLTLSGVIWVIIDLTNKKKQKKSIDK